MRTKSIALAFAFAAGLAAQQTIAPFKTSYGNFTQGIQFNGSYGAAGNVPFSTGDGTVWGTISPGTAIPGLTSDGANGIDVAGNVQANSGVMPVSIFPQNMRLTIDGASVTAGFDSLNEAYIATNTPGSGYVGTGTASVSGLTCSVQPTLGAVLDPQTGGVDVSITGVGRGCTGTGTVSISGFTGGSGFAMTLGAYVGSYPVPWPLGIQSLPALAGKVASTHNYSVSGTAVSDALARFASNGYGTICAGGSFNEYFLVGGDLADNSLINNSLTAQVTYGQWIAFTRALKSAGCKVIVSTAFLRGNPPTSAAIAAVNGFNQLVRTGTPGVDYDYLIDFGSQLQNTQDTGFFSIVDYTHFTHSGHLIAAQLANAALMAGGVNPAIGAPGPPSTLNGTAGIILSGFYPPGGAPAGASAFSYLSGTTFLVAGTGNGGYGSFNFQQNSNGGTANTVMTLIPSSSTTANLTVNGNITSNFNISSSGSITSGTSLIGTTGLQVQGAVANPASTASFGWLSNTLFMVSGSGSATYGNFAWQQNANGGSANTVMSLIPSSATTANLLVTGNITSNFAVVGASLAIAGGNSISALPASAVVGLTDTQALTNKTLDGVAPATMAFVDPTSSIQTQMNAKATAANTATIGNGACIKSIAGSTVTLGFCSTTLGAGGACTCN